MNRVDLEIIGHKQTKSNMTDKEKIDQLVLDYHALKMKFTK